MTCYRVGVGFDWTGDISVAAGSADATGAARRRRHERRGTVQHRGGGAAERFNTVVAATRSTAILNYLMTSHPGTEKHGQGLIVFYLFF